MPATYNTSFKRVDSADNLPGNKSRRSRSRRRNRKNYNKNNKFNINPLSNTDPVSCTRHAIQTSNIIEILRKLCLDFLDENEILKTKIYQKQQESPKKATEKDFLSPNVNMKKSSAPDPILHHLNSQLNAAQEAKAIDEVRSSTKEELFGEIINCVENEMSCVICSEVFIDPMLTKCGHVFCDFCLSRWIEQGEAAGSCPIRRSDISDSESSARKIIIIEDFLNSIHNLVTGEWNDLRMALTLHREIEAEVETRRNVEPPGRNSEVQFQLSSEEMYHMVLELRNTVRAEPPARNTEVFRPSAAEMHHRFLELRNTLRAEQRSTAEVAPPVEIGLDAASYLTRPTRRGLCGRLRALLRLDRGQH